jgi:hypothetical protein
MPSTFPEPSSTSDLRGLMLRYLDFYRSVIAGKIEGLEHRDLHSSTAPSGWTPAGLGQSPCQRRASLALLGVYG